MSVTARPSDSQFSATEQLAILRWKELQESAAIIDESAYGTAGPTSESNGQSALLSPRLSKAAGDSFPPSTFKPSKTMITRPDNPLTTGEKLLKMEDPTLCWCKKEAATFDTLEFGTIYECHNLTAFRSSKPQSSNDNTVDDAVSNVSDGTDKRKGDNSRSANSSPAIDGSTNGDQVFPSKAKAVRMTGDSVATSDKVKSKGRNKRTNICGFHVHKRIWDQFRSQLQAGYDLDPNHPELNICPAFNLTFCASFRLQNPFPKRFPPVPRCFCNFPVKMLMSNSGIHKNRVTFTCPNFDIDNARPKCSWALIAEEVPFIPSLICAHALIPNDSARTELETTSANPSNNPSHNASPRIVTDEDQVVASTSKEASADNVSNRKDSASSSVASDLNAPSEYMDARDVLTNESVDRQHIRWTKDRRTLSAKKRSHVPDVKENGADSMAGPSFSSYSMEVHDEEPIQEEMLEPTDQLVPAIRPTTSEGYEYGMYEEPSPQNNSSGDFIRDHQSSLWKTMMHNKRDHHISEWMTGLDIANHVSASQRFPHPHRVNAMDERHTSTSSEIYNHNTGYQPSVSSAYEPNASYGGNFFHDQGYGETNSLPPITKKPSQMVPSSVYKAFMTSKVPHDNLPSKSALLSTLTGEISSNDVAQPSRLHQEYLSSASQAGSVLNKQAANQSSPMLASVKSPPYAPQSVAETDLDPNEASKNLIFKQLDLMEATFQRSVSSLFLNQRKQLIQLQERMMAEMEGSQYPLYDYVAKLERTQRTLLLENELYKREKLHAEHSLDQMQQVHAEELDLRRSCQKRTASLEILVAEILQQNERLQQEIEEKVEVAKLSDVKCRVCWHNPITHATIPCYHCGKATCAVTT